MLDLNAHSYRLQHDTYRSQIVAFRPLPLSPSIASEDISRHGYDEDVTVYTFAGCESLVSEVEKSIQDSAIGTTYAQGSTTASSPPTIPELSVSEATLDEILDRNSATLTYQFTRLGSDGLPRTPNEEPAVQLR